MIKNRKYSEYNQEGNLMNMKVAFENFFEINNKSWKKLWGTLPKVPINEKYGQCILYVSSPDENNQ